MTVTRATLIDYLSAMIAELADEAQIEIADTASGFKYAIDQAIADLSDDTENLTAAYALAEYHALRRIRSAFAARIDFDATAIQSKRSQLYNQVDHLIADAANRASAAGHPITSGGSSGSSGAPAQTILWSTDWQEPEIVA